MDTILKVLTALVLVAILVALGPAVRRALSTEPILPVETPVAAESSPVAAAVTPVLIENDHSSFVRAACEHGDSAIEAVRTTTRVEDLASDRLIAAWLDSARGDAAKARDAELQDVVATLATNLVSLDRRTRVIAMRRFSERCQLAEANHWTMTPQAPTRP